MSKVLDIFLFNSFAFTFGFRYWLTSSACKKSISLFSHKPSHNVSNIFQIAITIACLRKEKKNWSPDTAAPTRQKYEMRNQLVMDWKWNIFSLFLYFAFRAFAKVFSLYMSRIQKAAAEQYGGLFRSRALSLQVSSNKKNQV